jgi:S1-C subfamily serine protease
MADQSVIGTLAMLSDEVASLVENAEPYIVRVVDGSQLTGTGVVWNQAGIVVTSSHGLERDEDLAIETNDGSVFPASLVGRDPETDLAVLKVEQLKLSAAPKADPNLVKVGHLVFAIGRPGKLGVQATAGLINSRYEVETNGQAEYILKTDATLYPGFSGGPLINGAGKVVGIVNRWFGHGSSVALGVPIVDQVVDSVVKHGRVQRGYLGIRTQIVDLPSAVQSILERGQAHGLLIVQVDPGSPADQCGLLLGDTLVGINSESLTDVDILKRRLQTGKIVQIQTIRAGKIRNVDVTIVAQS